MKCSAISFTTISLYDHLLKFTLNGYPLKKINLITGLDKPPGLQEAEAPTTFRQSEWYM